MSSSSPLTSHVDADEKNTNGCAQGLEVCVCFCAYVVAPVLNVATEMSVTADCALQFKRCSQTQSGATSSIIMRIKATDHIRATKKETRTRAKVCVWAYKLHSLSYSSGKLSKNHCMCRKERELWGAKRQQRVIRKSLVWGHSGQ